MSSSATTFLVSQISGDLLELGIVVAHELSLIEDEECLIVVERLQHSSIVMKCSMCVHGGGCQLIQPTDVVSTDEIRIKQQQRRTSQGLDHINSDAYKLLSILCSYLLSMTRPLQPLILHRKRSTSFQPGRPCDSLPCHTRDHPRQASARPHSVSSHIQPLT